MNRNYVIDRLKSRKVSIEEFNFDKLDAPPLAMFLSPYDIWELNGIAKSVKYSGKLREKLQMIDNVCRRRGLVKFASGTNRVVYRHPEFNNILFKIAYDRVGLKDNPAEFKNQNLLKPFVAKTFEISPCGTVGLVERVEPIKSREEFISIADDAYTLLNDFIVGRFIVSDCGSEYFMNMGTRPGFGVVLLDYTYVYDLDENKIFCNKPDLESPTGKCEGDIVYDDGFNHLYCSKCGAKYRAIELGKKIDDKEIIVKGKGENEMKVIVRGGINNSGTKVVSNNVSNDNFKKPTSNIVTNNERPTNNTNRVNKISLNNYHKEEYINKVRSSVLPPVRKNNPKVNTTPVVNEEVKTVNGVSVVETPAKVVEEPVVEAPKQPVVENKAEEYVEPFTIDESLADENFKFEPKNEPNPVEIIDEAVKTIVDSLNKIQIDAVKEDAINRLIEKVITYIPANGKAFKDIIDIAVSIYENVDDEDEYLNVVHSKKFVDFINRVFDFKVSIKNAVVDGNIVNIDCNVEQAYAYDNGDVAYVVEDSIVVELPEDTVTAVASSEPVENTEEDGDDEYNGLEYVNASTIKSNELFPSAEKKTVIVCTDNDGNYVTTSEGLIIAIDVINDYDVDKVTLVSNDWLANAEAIINSVTENEEVINPDTVGVNQVMTEE